MNIALIPFDATHLDGTLRWMNDPAIIAFSAAIQSGKPSEWLEQPKIDQTQRVFAIHLDGAHVGNLGLKNLSALHRTAELWLYIGEVSLRGKGVGRAALEALFTLSFECMYFRELYLYIPMQNSAAIRFYGKAGFSHEDLPEEEVSLHGGRKDLVRMGLLERRWRALRGIGKKVVLMQPHFLPWLGYYELMDMADEFIFLDDFQFSRQSRGQRNLLFLTPGKADFVTLPIKHDGNLEATFLDIREAPNTKWRVKFMKSMDQAYAHAPFRTPVMKLFSEWLSHEYENIAELEINLIERVAKYLALETVLKRSSPLNIRGLKRSWRVQALLEAAEAGIYYSANGSFGYMKEDGIFPLEKVRTYFQSYKARPYKQANSKEFTPNLSALDALFNLSVPEIREILHGTRQWLTWDEMIADSLAGRTGSGNDLKQAVTYE
jgi:RimJ/RimL family protein N-acetyltransferase